MAQARQNGSMVALMVGQATQRMNADKAKLLGMQLIKLAAKIEMTKAEERLSKNGISNECLEEDVTKEATHKTLQAITDVALAYAYASPLVEQNDFRDQVCDLVTPELEGVL